MRCPKCGAFIEDGKDTCFMCGANVNSFPTNNGFSNDYTRQKEAYDKKIDDLVYERTELYNYKQTLDTRKDKEQIASINAKMKEYDNQIIAFSSSFPGAIMAIDIELNKPIFVWQFILFIPISLIFS